LGDDAVHVDSVAGLPSACFTLSSACRSLGEQDRAGAVDADATSRKTASKVAVAVGDAIALVGVLGELALECGVGVRK